ncbi:unnamed protein product [Absidia cylindrospora]
MPATNQQRWTIYNVGTAMDSTHYQAFESRTKIALVERGGNCTWSDKVRTVTQLSTSLRLSVNVMLIYDNQSYASLPKYSLLPATGITTVPAYPSNQLPPQVNITQMDDNDISSSQLNSSNSGIVPNQPTEITTSATNWDLIYCPSCKIVSTVPPQNPMVPRPIISFWSLFCVRSIGQRLSATTKVHQTTYHG